MPDNSSCNSISNFFSRSICCEPSVALSSVLYLSSQFFSVRPSRHGVSGRLRKVEACAVADVTLSADANRLMQSCSGVRVRNASPRQPDPTDRRFITGLKSARSDPAVTFRDAWWHLRRRSRTTVKKFSSRRIRRRVENGQRRHDVAHP